MMRRRKHRRKPHALTDRDLSSVVQIEREVFGEHAWTSKDFRRFLRYTSHRAEILKNDQDVLAYMLSYRGETQLEIVSLAVRPQCQRDGMGTELIDRIKCRVSNKRPTIKAVVREGNLAAHLFLRRQCFWCVDIERQPWRQIDEDGYVFDWADGLEISGDFRKRRQRAG